jgi:uncharacterized protein YbcI
MPATPDSIQRDERIGGLSAAISTATVHLLREYTGRGPTRAKTYLNHDLITVVLQETLTKGERSLVNGGLERDVLHTRRLFQETMRDDLVAAIERLSGRSVTAFMSANHIDPDMAIESFVLEPEQDSKPESGSNGSGANPA